MTAPKVSLSQQAEAVRFAETRQRSLACGGTVRGERSKSVEEFDIVRLGAAARTLALFSQNEDELRAFLQLPAEARQAVLQHGPALAEICMELAICEATAKAGGPVR
ncbi:hypothetical protein [Bosea sp. 685]|uniref:hypothetical protein n=1 Tax=Bosea sp. 685 TaxID=3080057 RepID=UPI002892DEAA|nr:hypothetical protein [Bosea sp. 685]WNJ89145.1 hypothetical protein RMR04_22400 [Bosea sp. 685]